MKKHIGKNSHTSLLSEYKGNLFEFMVAHELSKIINTESEFLGQIAPNFQQLLRTYQQYIYEHDALLAEFLHKQAGPCAEFILAQRSEMIWNQVSVMGKVVANDSELTHEGDILLSQVSGGQEAEVHWPISLKIAKDKSYLNTKSAGVRSVFSKYFHSEESQKSLNHIQDIEYIRLSRELEALMDLEPSDDFNSWKSSSLSTRPGDLEGEARVFLNHYYEKLLICLEEQLQKLRAGSPSVYSNAISHLCGFQNSDITQIVAFHRNHDYKTSYFESHEGIVLESLPQISRDSGVTSLYIEGGSWRLQMRIKPMNAFTTKAIKVNCSVRYF